VKVYDPNTGKSYYQKRRKRFDEPGHARELTLGCYHGLPLLGSDRSRMWFLEALESARRQGAFELWAYVIMPEHVHLLIYPKPGVKVGEIIGKVKENTARTAVAYIRTHWPHWLSRITVHEGTHTRHRFWQPGGGFDRNVVDPAAVHPMIHYIHANPVRRGLVAKPEDWHWSSARWYAGIRPVPIEIDDTVPPLHQSGSEKGAGSSHD
jgi:putative transposase